MHQSQIFLLKQQHYFPKTLQHYFVNVIFLWHKKMNELMTERMNKYKVV